MLNGVCLKENVLLSLQVTLLCYAEIGASFQLLWGRGVVSVVFIFEFERTQNIVSR